MKINTISVLIVVVLTLSIFCSTTLLGLVSALLVDLSKEFDITVAAGGQLLTILAITWALVAPAIGPFSDRIGRKRMVVSGLVLSGASVLGYGLSWSFSSLLGFSVLFGLGGAAAGPNILAIVGDQFSPKVHGRVMSIVTTGIPVGYLAGVPAGALVADSLGWRWSFLVLGMLMIVTALAGMLILPSPRSHRSHKGTKYLSSFREAFRHRSLLPLVLANTLLQGAYNVVAVYLIAFLIQSYSLNIGQVAPFISFMAVGNLIGMLAGGPLADKLSKTKLCATTQALAGFISLVLMFLTPGIWLSVFLGGLFMGLNSSNRPAFFSLMLSISGTVRGTVMGIQATSNHLGRALGAMIGGLMLALVGYQYLGILCLVLSLFASATFLYVSSHMSEASANTAVG
ncbi:MFS transporter [Chloroflexota bacterium]